MTLYHYSAEPFVLDQTRVYHQDAWAHMKPCGLWLSVNDDWRDWCLGEDFHVEALAHRTEFVLLPDANVLHLDTAASVRAFASRYQSRMHASLRPWMIDWARVASDYQGLIIAPYQWQLRLDVDLLWYYGWDCESGCVWDCTTLRQVDSQQPARVDV